MVGIRVHILSFYQNLIRQDQEIETVLWASMWYLQSECASQGQGFIQVSQEMLAHIKSRIAQYSATSDKTLPPPPPPPQPQ